MPIENPVHADRARAESFGGVADEYDRFRPSYPDALIDDLVALKPAAALDIGCGTGKAARLLVRRGVAVLGIEVDPKMAAVARRHGVDVEVASFEAWAPSGRQFDLITCAQAWHWVDPTVGTPKAAGLLRPGGTLALFWNYDDLEVSAQRALDDVYREHAPELLRSVVVGGSAQSDRPHAESLEGSGLFGSVEIRRYRWERTFTRDEWVGLIGTHSDHLRLEVGRRTALLEAVGAAIDELGGTLDTQYGTYTVLARKPS
jgi:SAM-dependent methyltransferase